MQIKNFEAGSMSEALKLVKKEFGSEAVILSARKLKSEKGLFAFSKTQGIEITAAVDIPVPDKGDINRRNPLLRYSAMQGDSANRPVIKKRPHFIDSLRNGAMNYGRKINPMERDNISGITAKRQLFNAYHQMLEQDVDDQIALEIVRDIKNQTISDRYFVENEFNSHVVRALSEAGISAGRVKLENGVRKIVAVVGPTGVGKTSTIAKLSAAAMTRENKKKVALITLDEERIGAIEQLNVFAKILGIEVRSASNRKELKKWVHQFNDCHLLFIDTPGIQINNHLHMIEIKENIDKLDNIECHLVMSAATNEKTLKHTMEKYKTFNISRLIFTKLDECSTFGSILNQIYHTKIPVSYFANGPKIPEDIEAATLEKLINRMFNTKTLRNHLKGSPEMVAQSMIRFEKMLYGHENELEDHRIKRNKKIRFAASA